MTRQATDPSQDPFQDPFQAPSRDPSPTTDGSPGALRKAEGGASPGIAEPRVSERTVRPGSREAFSDRAFDDGGMSRSQSRRLPGPGAEASAALAARNATFGMQGGRGAGGTGGIGPTLARTSRTRFLHGRSWYFLLSVNILLAIVLSLTLVWVSIERMDTNYFINLERSNLRDKQSLHGKLEVERERLLSPYELRVNAERLGMKAPEPGQIRRMDLKKPIP